MGSKIKDLIEEHFVIGTDGSISHVNERIATEFAKAVARLCLSKLYQHQIPVGNSPAGEMAAEWTYDALKEIAAEIQEDFDLCKVGVIKVEN